VINNHIHSFGFSGAKLSDIFDDRNHILTTAVMDNFRRRGILAVDLKAKNLTIFSLSIHTTTRRINDVPRYCFGSLPLENSR
jgi:hypothetical protein